jgi:hypothetical protein
MRLAWFDAGMVLVDGGYSLVELGCWQVRAVGLNSRMTVTPYDVESR